MPPTRAHRCGGGTFRRLALAALAALACPSIVVARPPTILWLQTDSMDGRLFDPTNDAMYAKLKLTGFKAKVTSRAWTFARHYASSPQCVPSRTSMLTGRYVSDTRTANNGQGIAANTAAANGGAALDSGCIAAWNATQCAAFAREQNVSATLLDYLRDGAGYALHLFGRFDVGGGVLDSYPGTSSDGFHGGPSPVILLRGAAIPGQSKPDPLSTTTTGGHNPFAGDEHVAAAAAAFLRSTTPPSASDPPALVWLGVLAPHPPYDTNSSYESHVNASAVDPAPDAGPLHPYEAYQGVVKGLAGRHYSDDQQKRMRRAYWGAAAQATDMLLEVLAAAEAGGWLDNALVVVTSDHGEMSLEHGQDYKNSLLEPASRVPLLIMPVGIPGVPPPPPGGGLVTAPTSHMDILPTLLAAAGVSPPGGLLRGASLLPYLTGAARPDAPPPGRKPLVALQYHSNLAPGSAYGVVQQVPSAGHGSSGGNGSSLMKLIVYGRTALGNLPPQLFDLTADPFETVNLAASRPATVAALNASLLAELDVPAIDAERLASDVALYGAWFHAQCSPPALLAELAAAFKGVAEGELAARVAAWTGGLDPRNATGGGPGTRCPHGGGG